MKNKILEEIYKENNQLECVCCGKPVLMLPRDKQENGPIHVFCWMWGHPIEEHDYNHGKVWKTERYINYLSSLSPEREVVES